MPGYRFALELLQKIRHSRQKTRPPRLPTICSKLGSCHHAELPGMPLSTHCSLMTSRTLKALAQETLNVPCLTGGCFHAIFERENGPPISRTELKRTDLRSVWTRFVTLGLSPQARQENQGKTVHEGRKRPNWRFNLLLFWAVLGYARHGGKRPLKEGW